MSIFSLFEFCCVLKHLSVLHRVNSPSLILGFRIKNFKKSKTHILKFRTGLMVDAQVRRGKRGGSFFSIRWVQHFLRLTFASCLGSHKRPQFSLFSPCTFLVVFFFTGANELLIIFVVVSAHIWFIPPNGKIIRLLNMPRVIRGE